jgi:hypothetical protein
MTASLSEQSVKGYRGFGSGGESEGRVTLGLHVKLAFERWRVRGDSWVLKNR